MAKITEGNSKLLSDLMKRFPVSVTKAGNIRTCPVRLCFPKVWEPSRMEEGSKLLYSASILFPRDADLSVMVSELTDAANKKFGNGWKAKCMGKVIGNPKGSTITFPFRDGEEREQFGGYEAGSYFVNVTSESRPGVVDAQTRPITDRDDIYAGVWALVTLRPFAYDAKAKKGVSLGLQNIMKLADAEPLGGVKPKAEDEFEVIDGLDEDEMSLDAIM
jgi:hypothetical protein